MLVIVNGKTGSTFNGHPLSPFLFSFVVDVLGRMVVKDKNIGLPEIFLVGRDNIYISHLQFLDDTTFFFYVEDSKTVESFLFWEVLNYIGAWG